MKKTILFISIFFASCGSTYIKDTHSAKVDTAYTVIAYSFDWSRNDHRITTAKRVIKDSFALQKADTTKDGITQKRAWHRDTIYEVPILDSIILSDSITHKPLLDSLKKPIKQLKINWVILPKELLLEDYNKNFK